MLVQRLRHSYSISRLLVSAPIQKLKMAIHLRASFLLLACLASFQLLLVAPLKFEVGEDFGWAIPPPNDTNMYNEWASHHRFQMGDTVVFKYKDDSVMVVSEDGYDSCNAANPIRYYNNGDTSVALDDAGFHYFISGLSSHCEKGQKMIIKVMSHPKSSPEGSPPGPDSDESGAVAMNRFSSLGLVQLAVLIWGCSVFSFRLSID